MFLNYNHPHEKYNLSLFLFITPQAFSADLANLFKKSLSLTHDQGILTGMLIMNQSQANYIQAYADHLALFQTQSDQMYLCGEKLEDVEIKKQVLYLSNQIDKVMKCKTGPYKNKIKVTED